MKSSRSPSKARSAPATTIRVWSVAVGRKRRQQPEREQQRCAQQLAAEAARRLLQPPPGARGELLDLDVARERRSGRREHQAHPGEHQRPGAQPAREGVEDARRHRPQLRAAHRDRDGGARERRQEEEHERDGRERGAAEQQRLTAVARQRDAQEQQQHAPADRHERVAAEAMAELDDAHEHARVAPGRLERDPRPQALRDPLRDRGVVLERAADRIRPRSGTASATFSTPCEKSAAWAPWAAWRKPARKASELDDRTRAGDDERAEGHEVAPLRDRLVGDPLRRVARDARVAEALRGARAEGRRVEDHPIGVEVDHPGGEQDRPAHPQRRRRLRDEMFASHGRPRRSAEVGGILARASHALVEVAENWLPLSRAAGVIQPSQ